MLDGFVEFVGSLFVGVDGEEVRRLAQRLRQRNYHPPAFYGPVLPTLSQGDIFSPLPFSMLREDGGDLIRGDRDAPGVLISNTCDVEQDESSVVAFGRPATEWIEAGFHRADLESNRPYHLLHLPEVPDLGDFVFDLSHLQTVPSEWLRNGVLANRVNRHSSLSRLGYYFFLAKLTVHFQRPESNEVRRVEIGA